MVDRCERCGRDVPVYYLSQGFCDDCKWDTWIPRGYEAREAYEMDAVWRHANATRRPPLGVGFLDSPGPAVSLLLPMCRYNPRRSRTI